MPDPLSRAGNQKHLAMHCERHENPVRLRPPPSELLLSAGSQTACRGERTHESHAPNHHCAGLDVLGYDNIQ